MLKILIENPWATSLAPATLAQIREKSSVLAKAAFRLIQADCPGMLEDLAPSAREHFLELVYVAGCRFLAVDGAEATFSVDRWMEHLGIVLGTACNLLPNLKGSLR
jgi:hypothetical protein